MPNTPAASDLAPRVGTLPAPRAEGASRALSYVLAAVLLALTVSGLLIFTLSAR